MTDFISRKTWRAWLHHLYGTAEVIGNWTGQELRDFQVEKSDRFLPRSCLLPQSVQLTSG